MKRMAVNLKHETNGEMTNMQKARSATASFLGAVALWLAVTALLGCAPTASVQSGEEIQKELDLPEYDGPKARIAVGPCEDKTGGSGNFTVQTPDGETQVSVGGEVGRGMADMLVSALVNTDRFIVLESSDAMMNVMAREQEIEGNAEQQRAMQAAELVVTCAVTSFEPKASGGSGGVVDLVDGRAGALLGAVAGGTAKSTVTLDFRMVDTDTRAILSAFSVEGAARDVSLGGALLSAFSGGGGLGVFSNTPIEKAVRVAILEAVVEVVDEIPREYFGEGGGLQSDAGDGSI